MLLSQKYDLVSMNDIKNTQISDIAPSHIVNSDTGLLLQRHLTHVNPKVLEKKFPQLATHNFKLEVDNSGGYADRIQSLRTSVKGNFSEVGSAGGKTTIDVEDTTIPNKFRDTLIKWDTIGINKALLGNFNIVDRSMAGVIQVYNQEIDTAVIVGLDDVGIKGLSNNVHYNTVLGGGGFQALSATQQYNFITEHINAQHNAVNSSVDDKDDKKTTSVYAANICLMPTLVFNIIQKNILNEFNNASVLKVLRTNLPSVNFIHSAKLTDEMVIFSNTEDSISLRIPVPMFFSPIYNKHFEFSTKSMYSIAGVDILEPASGLVVSGLI